MATVAARASYFETGLEILADRGFGGLKLAEVCKRLGVTTGSFYHYFPNWAAYTCELIDYWLEDRSLRLAKLFRAVADPRQRMQVVIAEVLSLPHSAEAAIRAWGSMDPAVNAVQCEADRLRFKVCYDFAMEIVDDHRQAEVFAKWAVYMLVGYEQTTLPRDPRDYVWISNALLELLESGRFKDVPPSIPPSQSEDPQ